MKKQGWEEKLRESINKAARAKFEYGKNDCTIWSVNTIKSYSNLKWTPSWKNKKEAIKYHKSVKMEEEVSKYLGSPIFNINFTQRGDLVQKGYGINSALGICIGAKVVFLKEGSGIVEIPLEDCSYSWRV